MAVRNKLVPDEVPAESECRALADTLARVGDKWTVMVVGALAEGPMRYNALRRAVDGVSQRMLTLTLRHLEQDGLVIRTLYPAIPPRVDYKLTELGKTLIGPLTVLFEWSKSHRLEMEKARRLFGEDRSVGTIG